jgi:diadenosine tetraphosphate (Ap4A) HIT family hydrolase
MDNLQCQFCHESGGDILFEDVLCRVVLVGGGEGSAFPGYCRVIWNRHVREMSDLSAAEQRHLLSVVFATEHVVRDLQQPDKMNLASLGNVVPHVHWHVIPRWKDDSHFPAPIWAAAQRAGATRPAADGTILRQALQAALNNAGGIGR